jgi:hypothetical protein
VRATVRAGKGNFWLLRFMAVERKERNVEHKVSKNFDK